MSKNKTNIINLPIEDIMGERFGRYSKYIIQERALPDARDGLKPVQRRILYAMFNDGNVFEKPYRKSAKTVGLVIGNYHPHGDTSVYDAMVRMSQSWKMNHELIDMQGNNGSIDDDPAAAMRYTEARLSKLASTLMEDLDKDTVLQAPNFDDTILEPTVLPSQYPNLLVNGATGIAAGYATNIPPHNMNEIIKATIHRIQNPSCTLEDMMEIVSGPDFPTGGIVEGIEGIKDAFTTGRGRVVIRAKTEFNILKNMNQIIVTEIPYEVIKSNIVRKIDEIRINKDIDGILEVRDETDRDGLRIVVDLSKDLDHEMILNYLFKNTDLQVYYNYNMIAIVDKRPVQLGLAQLIDSYIFFKEEVVLNRTKFLYDKLDKRCHILEGLIKATSVMDEIIRLIRSSKDKAESKLKIIEAFSFTERQAEAIVTLQLYRLSSTDVRILKAEFAELVSQMENLKSILENREILQMTMVNELKQINELFSRTRLTTVKEEVKNIFIDETQMIANERVVLVVTQHGYVKTVSLRSKASSEGPLSFFKEDDQIFIEQEVDTLDTLLVFTDSGEFGYYPIYKLEEARWKDIGFHISKYIKFDKMSRIVKAVVVKNFNTQAWIISITKLGMIKRTPISDYELSRYTKSSMNMTLKPKDEVVECLISYYDDQIALVSKNGFFLKYELSTITPTAPKGQGVIAINLDKTDELSSASIVNDELSDLVLVNTKGQMKRFKINDLKQYKRANKGDRCFKLNKSNPLYSYRLVSGNINSEMMFYDEGLKQLFVKEVPLMSFEASFSTQLTLNKNFYLLDKVEEVLIKDFIEEEKEFDFMELELN